MRKLLKDQSGFAAFGVVLAVLFGAVGGAVVTVEQPKVYKVVKEDVLHKNDTNYEVPENPSPSKTR